MNYINGYKYSCPRCREFLTMKNVCARCMQRTIANINKIIFSCGLYGISNSSYDEHIIILSKHCMGYNLFWTEKKPNLKKEFTKYTNKRLKIIKIFDYQTLQLITTESLIKTGCCHDVINIILSFL